MEESRTKLLAEFEKARKIGLLSGSIKFDDDYVSGFDLFIAVKKWVESDSRVLAAAIRGGGDNQTAVDFRFQMETNANKLAAKVLNSEIAVFFEKVLGGKYMVGWDYSNSTRVVK